MMKNEGRYVRFSEAPVWDWQRAYYEQMGLEAWENHQVPQYITSNPFIATAYAEMIFSFLQDLAIQGGQHEMVTIIELGAGAGRLAHQVLNKLSALKEIAGMDLPPFRYVMTDLAMENVTGWKEHPSMQAYIEQGILDFARFDAIRDTELNLIISEKTVTQGDLQQPLLLIANYFFDSIPQDLIYIGEGQVFECDLLVELPQHAAEQKPAEILEKMTLQYNYRPAPDYTEETYPYSELISLYRAELEDSHILIPSAGLGCLERLSKLSRSGYVLITADKGDHRLDYWKYAEPPEFALHGSFSLSANYHAIKAVMEQQGASTYFTAHHYKDLNVGMILMLEEPNRYVNTRLAYHRFVERFGPDDFFSLKEWADLKVEQMNLRQLLAFWRLGGYDAEFLMVSFPRFKELLDDASDEEMFDLQFGIKRMWSSYYAMEHRNQVALISGQLLLEMFMYEEAKIFLEELPTGNPDVLTAESDAQQITVLYDLAVCCYELEMEQEALDYARLILEIDPNHEEAAALRNGLERSPDHNQHIN
ncbi:tetratricopeptide repeat protein [Paenibacillus polysaccharolyticus]|uniref:tetratricopeptide repeat protein n=1 Tax=Paenibacillus polysaccharolyticus TaxID=582692 RepID=UPI002040C0A0|nr:tetratricopeptide repeat protein [Paenibacillus polysaccharolyticus]MCM3133778.1 tetratricopeptide repeat protein [Paenibacillus polysaccharolyticus]